MKFIKLRIFSALHRPVGRIQLGYHLFIIFHSFITAFVLNILNIQGNCPISYVTTKWIDLMLAVILIIETILQLWCSSCITHYNHFFGKLNYIYDHLAYKAADLLGISTYVGTFIYFTKIGYLHKPALAVAHLTQIIQIYRITHRPLQLISHTMKDKLSFIFSLFLFTLSVFLVLSHVIYLAENGHNEKINNINDASWLVFITMITVGFGDVGPVTKIGKILIATYLFFGIVSFSVMISLFGAQLASENEKSMRNNILCLVPAAVLIQNVWILYFSRKEDYLKIIEIDEKDCIIDQVVTIYLYKLKYQVSRKHFMVTQSSLNAFDENILFYEYLHNRLSYLEKSIYHNSHQLDSINNKVKLISNHQQ